MTDKETLLVMLSKLEFTGEVGGVFENHVFVKLDSANSLFALLSRDGSIGRGISFDDLKKGTVLEFSVTENLPKHPGKLKVTYYRHFVE